MELENTIKNNSKQLEQLGNNKLNILIDDSIKLLNEYLRKRYSQNVEKKNIYIKKTYIIILSSSMKIILLFLALLTQLKSV